MPKVKQLHLTINTVPSGRHDAAWRLDERPEVVASLDHYIEISKVAERGTFDAVFLPDYPGLDHTAAFRPWLSLDPTSLVPALAAVTENVGFIATVSTTFDHPYNVARRFASLDHITQGRSAWNVVTTQHNEAAANFGTQDLPSHGTRLSRAEEFLNVVTSLWASWDEGAILADSQAGVYTDLSRVREINHIGEFFNVKGPLQVPPTGRGRPIITIAGSSEATQKLAGNHADVFVTVQRTMEGAQDFYKTLKRFAEQAGRDPDGLKVLPGLYPVIGSTEAEAKARKELFDDLLDAEAEKIRFANRFGVDPDRLKLDERLPEGIFDVIQPHVSKGFAENIILEARKYDLTVRQLLKRNTLNGHRVLVGTPTQIADDMELWFKEGAADGFTINADSLPDGLALFVDHVVPELRKRNLFRSEYSGSTLAARLGRSRSFA